MLSSIGRAAIRRGGAGASYKSTNRVLQRILLLQRVAKANNVGSPFSLRQFSSSLLRSYATTTAKAKPKTKTSAPKAKSTAKKAAPKKPVKKAVRAKPKRKVASKPKPKAKPRKKVLTPKQKERTERQKQTLELKSLKATALTLPKAKPATVWTVILTEAVGKSSSLTLGTKEASAKYKSLTASELEHYNHIANQNKEENQTAYKKFIESHKPEEIRLANNARHLLAKRDGKKASSRLPALRDPRIPKLPSKAGIFFGADRWNSGDLKGLKIPEASRLIWNEWKELSPSERKPYEDQEAADKTRYIQEYKTVFGRDPLFVTRAAAA
ncbi:Non-histone chromosomal 6 [Hyphodiscus hymeniophilus]|uniref:Non-histone chromosomal 6 n=1 Tax=Hyphodiscus hymeniophilus TaxID=353542 RepID=A0A9P7AY84_9HELO|nr:Non-histone chromosomal 6 [Hyphodiscus hymeniophilus]